MKGALALSWDDRVVVSPHIGEMDSPRSLAVFEQVAADLQALYGVEAETIACDAHSGYTTHQWARRQDLPVFPAENVRDVSPGGAQRRFTGNAATRARTARTSRASRNSPGGGN